MDVELAPGFSGKLHLQYPRLSSPVKPTPHIYATVATIGLVCKLESNRKYGL